MRWIKIIDPPVYIESVPLKLPSFLVTVMVLSRVENVATRDAIRESWIDATSYNRLFFIGQLCPGGSDGISCNVKSITSINTNKKAIDTVTLGVTDVYHHLPRKLKLAYAWTLKFTDSRWIVKTDEDFFVNGPNLIKLLMKFPSKSQVVGCIMHNAQVHREGKWKETAYTPNVYPPFPLGSCGHAITKDVAEFIVNYDGYEYQGEDTSLGIWSIGNNNVTMSSTPYFSNTGQCNDVSKAIMGHQFRINDMYVCKKIHHIYK